MSWQAALARQFGAEVAASQTLTGGDLSEVQHVTLADGRQMALKRGSEVAVEARMLASLDAAGAPVPAILWQEGDLLCLEWLDEVRPTPENWAALGHALRALHQDRQADYGWPEDYAFGPLPICNRTCGSWPTFWAEHRLLPFLPVLPEREAVQLETLCQRLPDLLPAQPDSGLLHGDLWMGNIHFSTRGARLIDAACYHGDGEVDLAMLDLFGPPHPAFIEAYGPVKDRQERRAIYQLFPALVHLRLFGRGYHPLVVRLLDEALS